MAERTEEKDGRWFIALAWVHRTAVVLNLLLFGLVTVFDLGFAQFDHLIVLTAAIAFCSTLFFAIRMLKNRGARNDFMLGVFWLIFAFFVARSLFMEPPRILILRRH